MGLIKATVLVFLLMILRFTYQLIHDMIEHGEDLHSRNPRAKANLSDIFTQ